MKILLMVQIFVWRSLEETEIEGTKCINLSLPAKILLILFLQKKIPNFKVDPFVANIQSISIEAWDMGWNISCTEQTIGLEENHGDKQRISYKKKETGF